MQSLRERRTHRSNSSSQQFKKDSSPSTSPLSHHVRTITASKICIIVQTFLNLIFILIFLSNRHRTTTQALTKDQSVPSSPLLKPSPSTVYDCHVTVYIYDRPNHLLNLLHDIAREADAAHINVAVNVIDDNSYACQYPPQPHNIYEPHSEATNASQIFVTVPLPNTLPCQASHRFIHVEKFAHHRGWSIFVSKYRHSRRRYWHLIRHAHLLLRDIRTRFHLFLPDDDRLARNFFPTVFAKWHQIEDSRKLTLMLHVEETREHVPVWTDLKPRPIGNHLTRIGWVESGNFLCTSELLQFLNWSFPYIPVRRWIDNPPISSGVGATLSHLIHDSHRRMYRTDQSFVAHVGTTLSKMNAQFRSTTSPALLTKYFADGDKSYHHLLTEAATVTASIASHWVRETSLHAAVYSLAPQVDHLNVYLNGYESIPAFLQAPFISVIRSDDPHSAGDIGDIGKFFWCNNLTTEYHLTADDDIIYPPDYVSKLRSFHQQYRTPLVVGVHGIRMKNEMLMPKGASRHSTGYYGSREVWMATQTVAEATNVHIIGTGTMLYKVAEVGPMVLFDVFQKKNMADIWFGLLMQERHIPMMVIPHEEGWLVEVVGTFEDSIYKRSTRSRSAHRAQTLASQSIASWKLFKPSLAQ